MSLETRKCTGCNINKTIDKFPFRNDTKKYRSRCRDCENEYARNRKKNNADAREQNKLACKIYHEKNKEKMNEQARQYHKNHREEHKEKCKDYYEKNKEHLKQKAKERRDKLKNEFNNGNLDEPKINTKSCTKCNEEKSIELFPYRKNRGVYESRCKKCCAEIEKARRLAKRDEINTKRNTKIKSPQIRMAEILRKRIGSVVKNIDGRNIYFDLLGCNRKFFKIWFEYQFEYYSQYNLNWDNHGTVWQIEHVMPCNSFDLTDEEQQKICFHWTNTSCVPKIINLSKGSKVSVAHIVGQKVRIKQFIEKLNTKDTQQLKYKLL